MKCEKCNDEGTRIDEDGVEIWCECDTGAERQNAQLTPEELEACQAEFARWAER